MHTGQELSRPEAESALSSWSNIPCPGCACVCDDVTLTFRDHQLVEFQPDCPLGEQWFRVHSQPGRSLAEIEGEPADLFPAIDHAAALLSNADYPLIYGLSRSATP